MTTPACSLAESNSPPTPQEAIILRAQAADLERKRRRLSDSVNSRLEDVDGKLNLLATILAPVRRVPLEVLGEIFLCMPSEERPRNYQHSVTKVSLVCKTWRDAARFTPRLWCDLWARADALAPVSYEAIAAWTSRAGSVPRSLEISSTICGGVEKKGPDGYENDVDTCAGSDCVFLNPLCAKLLTKAAITWSRVTLNCPSPDCLLQMTKMLKPREPDAAAMLRDSVLSIEIGMRKWSHWPAADGPDELFSFIPESVTALTLHLPKQTTLGWFDGCWRSSLSIPSPILRSLTSLELSFGQFTDISGSSILNALQHCTNLEFLKIDFNTSFVSPPERDPPTTRFTKEELLLPKLQYLHLPQFNTCFGALQALKMPSLQELYLSLEQDDEAHKMGRRGPTPYSMDSEWDRAPDAKELIDFVRGGRDAESPLRVLHIKAASFYGDLLFHLLRELRSLTHLRLEWLQLLSHTPDDSFSNLIIQSPLCMPDLKTLEIINLKHSPDFEIPSLRAFVEERHIDLTLTYHDHVVALEQQKEDDKLYGALDGWDSDEKYWNPSGAIWWDL